MTGQIPSDANVLARLFSNRGIATDQIAVYNSPAFLAEEKADPALGWEAIGMIAHEAVIRTGLPRRSWTGASPR